MIALLEKSRQTTGLEVSYIELQNVGITLVGLDSKNLCCILFHDEEDGEDFGRLLASQILLAFVDTYMLLDKGLTTTGAMHNLSDFLDFHLMIGCVIRDSVGPVLEELQRNRAVVLALLVTDDATDGDSTITYSTGEVDRFGVLANLKPLISAATDVMSHQRESMKSLWLESSPSRASRLFVRRIDNATLVVQFSKRFEQTVYISELERAAHLLKKVVTLGEMLS
mmetsp:Transcript_13831/g.17147  ORF Transcript_13831/g.17147 Transcript_13831/m.17147 type:complete len:225 (-) Transcript_13831:2262-2936(-)